MAMYAELFDGTKLEFPDGTDPSVIASTAKRLTLERTSGEGKSLEAVGSARKPEDIGYIERNIGAGKGGVESLGDVGAGLSLAGSAMFGTNTETAAKMQQIKKDQSKPQETPGLTVADIERIYKQKGLGAAASQVPSYITESILRSAPQMAIPLAAGAVAGTISGPFAPIVAPLVGIGTYGIQQFGNFLNRQAVEKDTPQDLELKKAALTAGATAPLGYFTDKFVVGLGGIGAKKAGAEIIKELSARQVAAKVGKRVVGGATKGIIAEAPLEVLEQAAERYQAGLSLTGDDANKEYKEAFFGGAAAGAGIGGASRGIAAYQTPVKSKEKTSPKDPTAPPKDTSTPPSADPNISKTAPPSSSQNTQAMIDEFNAIPPDNVPPESIPPSDNVPPSATIPPDTVPPSTTIPSDTVPPESIPPTDTVPPVGNEIWENIQNRDRSSDASIKQMTEITNKLDYDRVSLSKSYAEGAPIVAGADVNSTQLGRKDTVTGSDGNKVPIQYAAIEAKDVIASHNASGIKNPSYIDQSIPSLRAITNGRVAGIQAAYDQGLEVSKNYKTAFANDDFHGISREVIEGMKNPMLVRIMPMDQVNKNTGDVSNTGAGLTFNFVEQAKNDTNRVDLSKITFTDTGDVTPQTIKDFVAAMPTTEQGNLMGKDGQPTKQAVDRVNAAIFQQAYGNDKLTELAFQSQDDEARNIVRALNMSASKAIRLADAGDYDVRPLVNEAVEMAITARRNNMSLKDLVAQGDLTANPLTKDIIQMFADNPRSAKAIGENLSNLFDNAFTENSKTGEDMFGIVPKRPVDELVRDSFAKKVEPDLFDKTQSVVEEKLVAEEKEPKDFDISKTEFEIHQEIKNLDATSLAKWLVANARNKAAKYIAEKIEQQITKFEKAGVNVKIIMLNGKDRHKRGVQGTSGIKISSPGRNVFYEVKLNGLNSKGKTDDSSIGYQIIMHEMLHTVSQLQIFAIRDRKTKDYQEIQKDLASILRAVRQRNREEAQKDVIDQHAASYQKRFYKNTDELFAYGLSNSTLQDYLSTIKVGDKTAFTKLVEIMRKLLGISSEYDTALDKLMRVGDRVFQMSTDEIADIAKELNFNFGEGVLPDSAATNIAETAPIPNKGIPNIIKKLITKKQSETVQKPTKEKKPATAPNYKGQPVEASWAFPEDRFIRAPGISDISIDTLIYKIQDKFVDLKRMQQGILKAAGEITDGINAYDKEQLFHGKVATGVRNFLLNELYPVTDMIKKFKLTTKDVQDYLLARHAEERNNQMNELNKLDPRTGKERDKPWDLQDKASGMSTADAKEYLANLDPKKKENLETLGGMFDKMVAGTQKILVDSGAESAKTIDAWNDMYKHYMPLFRVEEDFNNSGNRSGQSKGFNVSGKFSKRAMGSEKEVQNIVNNLLKQRERALIRAEKLTVIKSLYGLFLVNPNPDIALPVNPDAIKSREALITELEGLGYADAATIADNLMAEPKTRYISKKIIIDKDTGLPTSDTEESVRLKTDNLARFGDNVVTLQIDGKDRYIFFNKNDPNAMRLALSLKNLDVDSLGAVLGIVAKGTRWFANVNTQYNPIFAAVNLIRDVGGAQTSLTTTPLKGKQAQVTAGIFPAMGGIFKVLRAERGGEVGGNSPMENAFREFREAGGQTGYRDALARKESEKSIVDDLLKQKGVVGNGLSAMKSVFGALSDFNDTLENSIRLSAFIEASKPKSDGGLGLSKQQAAVIAKNLTVNFDKKGAWSANVNALYAFFNASVQGTARLGTTLTGPKGKAIIGGGVLLGSMQAVLLAAAGFRDDEPPEFVKQKNFVLPTPDGNYITIPYPLGLNILPNTGRILTEFMLSGGKNPAKKTLDLFSATVDAFSPIGSSTLLQTIAPTVLDPVAAIAENKDSFGRPIYKEDRATNPTPGYMRSRENASEISKGISYYLNLASGGGKYSKGYISPTADEIDYLAGQVTGGLGREIMKAGEAVKTAGTGEDLPAYRVPLLGRFYGETESNAAESQRFYNNVTRMADHENEVKGRIKNRESVAEYYRDNPRARLYQQTNAVENQINALNKQKKEFIERGLPKERIKRIEDQKATIMKRFNDRLEQIEE